MKYWLLIVQDYAYYYILLTMRRFLYSRFCDSKNLIWFYLRIDTWYFDTMILDTLIKILADWWLALGTRYSYSSIDNVKLIVKPEIYSICYCLLLLSTWYIVHIYQPLQWMNDDNKGLQNMFISFKEHFHLQDCPVFSTHFL